MNCVVLFNPVVAHPFVVLRELSPLVYESLVPLLGPEPHLDLRLQGANRGQLVDFEAAATLLEGADEDVEGRGDQRADLPLRLLLQIARPFSLAQVLVVDRELAFGRRVQVEHQHAQR